LDDAQKKRLAEQLAPGAVNIIQKYVQVGQGTANLCATMMFALQTPEGQGIPCQGERDTTPVRQGKAEPQQL
jgi:hypothetical protein